MVFYEVLLLLSGVLSALSVNCPGGNSHLVVQIETRSPCDSCGRRRVEVRCVEGASPVSGLETAVIFCLPGGIWRHVQEM